MTTFRSTPLFGGALIADLPSTFADVRLDPVFCVSKEPLIIILALFVKFLIVKRCISIRMALLASSSTSLSVLVHLAALTPRMVQHSLSTSKRSSILILIP